MSSLNDTKSLHRKQQAVKGVRSRKDVSKGWEQFETGVSKLDDRWCKKIIYFVDARFFPKDAHV